MADSSPLAGLLDRAGRVFSLAEQLGSAFREEFDRQGTGFRTVDPTAWSRHEAAFNTFSAAVLDLREEMQNPQDGFAPVAQVLMEAARVAKQIRDTMQTSDGQTWQSFLDFRFHFNSIVANGNEAVRAATKSQRLNDPFAFLEQPAKITAGAINTTPIISKPPVKLIEAAERSIPVILADVPADSSGQTLLPSAAHLVALMQKAGHTLAAAQWAIHESVVAGRLETGRVEVGFPSVKTDTGWTGGGRGTKAIPKDKPAPFDCFKVTSTAAMFAWWRSLESRDQPKPESTSRTTDSLLDPFAMLSRFEEPAPAAPAAPPPIETERSEGGKVDPIRRLCDEAKRLTDEHAERCSRTRPPRCKGGENEWWAGHPARERQIESLVNLSHAASTRGRASGLPAPDVAGRIDQLIGAVRSLLFWVPMRCRAEVGEQDGPDIEADPSHWMHAQAVEWRTSDENDLRNQLHSGQRSDQSLPANGCTGRS